MTLRPASSRTIVTIGGDARPPEPAKRGRPPSLTEERIIAGALELCAATPLDQVSMRALAAHLDVPVMTVYNYVPNRAALSELVQNSILSSVQVPTPDAGPWHDRLRTLQRDARAAASGHAHAGLGGIGGSAEARRLADGVRDILEDGGFPPAEVTLAFTALFTFMIGQIEVDALAAKATIDGVTLPMPSGTAAPNREAAFDYGFDILLAGLRARLEV